ncbi:hypothetical protein GCM10020358_81450 [Amorphoplanes nipponensis]
MSWAAAVTSGTDMAPPSQPMALPSSSATSPMGRLKGSRTSVSRPISSRPRTGRAIHAAFHICPAGFIEMKVMEMPARVPSRAARGAYRRMYGPTKAPISTITPMMNAHATPAVHAWTGSLVRR